MKSYSKKCMFMLHSKVRPFLFYRVSSSCKVLDINSGTQQLQCIMTSPAKTEEEDKHITCKPRHRPSKNDNKYYAEGETIDLTKDANTVHEKQKPKTQFEEKKAFYQRLAALNSQKPKPRFEEKKDFLQRLAASSSQNPKLTNVKKKPQDAGVEVIDLSIDDEQIDLTCTRSDDDPAVIAAVRSKHNHIHAETTYGIRKEPQQAPMMPRVPSMLLTHSGSAMGKVIQQASPPLQSLGLGQLAPASLSKQESPKRLVPEQHDASTSPNKKPKRNRKKNNFHSQSTSHPHVHHEKQRKDVSNLLPSLGNSLRSWELTDFGRHYYRADSRAHSLEFSVMSYNILAQDLLEDNIYLYQGFKQNVLDWEKRKHKIMDEITFYKPDIICLQEVNCHHYEGFFVPKFKELGYRGVFKQRTGGKHDGCAIMYNKDLFEREQVQEVEYLQRQFPILDRDNVGLIVKLKPLQRKSEESLFIANTHLLYNPARGDVKLAQLMLLLAELDRISCAQNRQTTSKADSPIIICGDFNSTPSSDIYKFITKGQLWYENLRAGTLSGQRPWCTRNKVIMRDFFPRELGISDQCQYIDTRIQRMMHSSASSELEKERCKSPVDPSLCSLGQGSSPIHQGQTQPADGISNNAQLPCQNSGYLNHHLNLESVYHHRIERLKYHEREVTTQHSQGGCIVDYILYNVLETSLYTKKNKERVVEGKLKVLARLGLLSEKEIERMGNLPNNINPSDHLPLLTKFLLN
ncbi:hypothetical protein FSP39_015000 [Pinctada imbricata]|uniref:Endonuclease/exonuclease/phosphatase domain-containing protein n=1 Tax=Pinctada imbricata TaxID=66713 RepID=A0AA88Y708_PINIB|nr:hypothetical protein FSP39_015000 [Pinctada imbricata]